MADTREIRIGQLAVKKGLITGAQLAEVLRAQEEFRAATGQTRQVGDLMVERGLIEQSELQTLLSTQASRGTRQLGGFTLISRLGAGGMGAVYRATQNSMDRTVALKVLPPKLARDASFIERFLREARSVARLNHPNIVQGIDVGEASGYYYFAMELVEGCSLKDVIQQRGTLPEKEALEIVEQVVRGLQHAHAHGLIHRDIKPDNILLDKNGTAKICDLGLARQAHDDSSLTQTGVALGTPHYISPEQARGESTLDARTDLYSLGATWFHMLAGRPPYIADNALAVITKHLTDPVPRLSSVRQGPSAGVEAAIARLMAKSPDGRYASAEELLKDIEDLKAGRRPRLAAAGAPGPGAAAALTRARDTRQQTPVGRRPVRADLPDGIDPAVLGAPPPGLPRPLARRPVQAALAGAVLLLAVAGGWGLKRALVGGPPAPPTPDSPAPAGPGDAPPGTPADPGPGPAPASDRLALLEEMHQSILRTVADNPDDLDRIEARWQALQADGAGTKYRLIATDELARIAARRAELDAGKTAEARERLEALEKRVTDAAGRKEFAAALEQVRAFPRSEAPVPEAAARLAALERRVRSAAAAEIDRIVRRCGELAAARRFDEARRALAELDRLGLAETAEVRSRETARVAEAERGEARRQDTEQRRLFREKSAAVRAKAEARLFAEALSDLQEAAKGLSPAAAAEIASPDLALFGHAGRFMELCRQTAAQKPADIRLTVQGVRGRIADYDPDPAKDSIKVLLKIPAGDIYGEEKLARLPAAELLILARATDAAAAAPETALAAGCFLAASGSPSQARAYLDRAREARLVDAALERALAMRERGEAEVLAEEKFAALEAALAAKRWPECAALAEDLLKTYAGTQFLRPRTARVGEILEQARYETSPPVRYELVFQNGRAIPELGIAGYRGTADTYLSGNHPASAHGAETGLKAFNRGQQAPLLRFDLSAIPAGARVEKAVLELHCLGTGHDFQENVTGIGVHPMKVPWSERTSSYNRREETPGGAQPWTEPGAGRDRDTSTNWGLGANGRAGEFTCAARAPARCDVTALAAAWTSGQLGNHGVYLHCENGLALLASREHETAELRPRLTVTFLARPIGKTAQAGLPREPRFFALDTAQACREFADEFGIGRFAPRGTPPAAQLQLGGGEIRTRVGIGELLLATSRSIRLGAERSLAFEFECSDKLIPDRGQVAFGFPLGDRPDLHGRPAVALLAQVGNARLASALFPDIGQAPRVRPTIRGEALPGGERPLGPWQVRFSWRAPTAAWFVNGRRVAIGKLPPAVAADVSAGRAAIFCGMFPSPEQNGDEVTVRIRGLAVGLPRDDDFRGAEDLPQPPDAGPGPAPGPDPVHGPMPRPEPRPRPGGPGAPPMPAPPPGME